MKRRDRHNNSGKLLVKRLALGIAVLYLLSPFQQHISTVLHTLSHSLSSPEYVMTHFDKNAKEELAAHQFGDHKTTAIIHEHLIVDLVQTLLEGNSEQGQQSDPVQQTKTLDKHLVNYTYSLKCSAMLFQRSNSYALQQAVCLGYSDLWLEPPITALL